MKIYKNKITIMVTIIIECILLAACGNNIDEKNNININEDAKEIEIPVVNISIQSVHFHGNYRPA